MEENTQTLSLFESADPPVPPLLAATERVRASLLDQSGIKTVRVLSESAFHDVLTRLVEDRVRARLAAFDLFAEDGAATGEKPPAPEPLSEVREEYRERWEEFRSRFEEKLRALEERARALAARPPRGR
jgi:hypothetical protein